ncbi:MAG: molybdate ABC transporter substrate-binding protein [Cyanobacteria bacterium J06554_3]
MARSAAVALTLLALPVVALSRGLIATDGMGRASNTQRQEQQTLTLTISAAASLQNALIEIQPLFEAAHPNVKIYYNWGGSGTLQRQIERGAPADIFFSASTQQMDSLARQQLILAPSKQVILTNQLALIAPKGGSVDGFEDLITNVNKIAVGDFVSVPAGQYAQTALSRLTLLPKINSRLVFFNNVRGVLSAVESGHAQAGFVYLTDARLSDRVAVVAIAPPQTHAPIHYPIAILKRTPHAEAAQQYIDFLNSSESAQIFQKFGFEQK